MFNCFLLSAPPLQYRLPLTIPIGLWDAPTPRSEKTSSLWMDFSLIKFAAFGSVAHGSYHLDVSVIIDSAVIFSQIYLFL